MERLDVAERWPDLFEGLTDERRQSVLNTLAGSWHEGWVPNRPDVKRLIDYVRGGIDINTAIARELEAARATNVDEHSD